MRASDALVGWVSTFSQLCATSLSPFSVHPRYEKLVHLLHKDRYIVQPLPQCVAATLRAQVCTCVACTGDTALPESVRSCAGCLIRNKLGGVTSESVQVMILILSVFGARIWCPINVGK